MTVFNLEALGKIKRRFCRKEFFKGKILGKVFKNGIFSVLVKSGGGILGKFSTFRLWGKLREDSVERNFSKEKILGKVF